MKRNIIALLTLLFAVVQVVGQTYDNLWKQACAFQKKDQPRSEMNVMEKIVQKAILQKDYGQLLAAEMRQALLWKSISLDSLASAVHRMEMQAQLEHEPMLQAVWNAALGKIYREHQFDIDAEESNREDVNERKSSEFFRKALANPEMLAAHASTEYVPLTLKGMDGSSFNNDMLHLIGFEADSQEAYLLMHDYYAKVGNRGAACLCAFEMAQKDRLEDTKLVRKSKYLNTIDSLIHVYRDVPEVGELAVEHYRFMEGAMDAKVSDKISYINYALSRWGGWSRMNVLRNAQKRLTEPMFSVDEVSCVVRPGQKQWIRVNVRNLQCLKMSISRLGITADNEYDINDEATYRTLLKKTSPLHQRDKVMQFYGHPEYETVKDSFEIAGLPLGAYLMEMSSDNPSVPSQRMIFYVSDLALLSQQLPDDTQRYVVVNATTGQPVAGAQILIYTNDCDLEKSKDKREAQVSLTTDENGEAICKKKDGDILIFTTSDKYTPARYTRLSHTRYYENNQELENTRLYTDRSIYRPGQTVHAISVSYFVMKGRDARVVNSRKDVKFTLRDANYKVVTEKSAQMDEYGTASVDFELPLGGLTGRYVVMTDNRGVASFRVEEYKRPTFEVIFPQVNEKYAWGDTVVVKASAKTYAGVPVQGAKVSYRVMRRSPLWWWRNRSADQTVMQGEGVTREDGTFDVEIPMDGSDDGKSLPAMNDLRSKARFFNFDVEATVTDASGESHEGGMSLPLGTRAVAFSSDMPGRIEADSLKNVTFSYCNAGGMEVAGVLRYRIDRGAWVNAETNKPISVKEYTEKQYAAQMTDVSKLWLSGRHELEAVCGEDTLRQDFVLFSIKDTHPAEPTVHWSYQTAGSFPRDGKPVYLQVGTSENGVHIVYSIIAGNKLIEKGAWELGDSIVTLPFTYKDEYASGIVLNYSFVKEGKCYTNVMRIARPLPEKKLNVTWKTFRNRLTPGQKEEWTIHVTTADGKPARAQLMSVLYDKSLDAIVKHTWDMSLGLYQNMPNCYWNHNLRFGSRRLAGSFPTKYYEESELTVDRFDTEYFECSRYKFAYENSVMLSKLQTVSNDRSLAAVTKEKHIRVGKMGTSGPFLDSDVEKETRNSGEIQVRENLNETAFFYPALESDDKGNVAIKFTLPESVTTWKFMGLVHDKEMRNGSIVDEAVAKKTIMVQPNMPRFLREGDKATIVTKVFNTSDKKVGGNVRMQLIDPETNRVVWQFVRKYSIEATGTAIVGFDLPEIKEGIYINKVVATGNGYSDGEQHYLPVLSDLELVTNTLPFTLTEKGVRSFDLTKVFVGKDSKQIGNANDAKVTVEYTNNPSWLMIQALPTVSNPKEDNAISLMAAIYSNSIARYIMRSSPVVKQVVELWKQEVVSTNAKKETALTSCLEKNSELKNVILSETPWLMDADRESEQKALLTSYFDESLNASRLVAQVAKLKALQQNDGSFSWWKGMSGSRYMTTAVAKMMVRLNKMVGSLSETASMLTSALSFLQKETATEVKEMKKKERGENKGMADLRPSDCALDYLYILSVDGRKLNESASADMDYLVRKLEDKTCEFTIYGKAQASVILAKNGKLWKAAEYLRSIQEYSVSTSGMGRYFDTHKAYYSWCDYRIPTQVAAIEAVKAQGGKVDDMQLWLLQSKRTQAWQTPVNTVDAVYAFMDGQVQPWEKASENAALRLDGKSLVLPKATLGLGYVKVARQGTARTLRIDKKNEGTSWGAVYAQFTQSVGDIESAASGIAVTRKIGKGGRALVGDKVKVVLTITADRDYDFVQIVDKRAACLEPVNQQSGYQWGLGCYVSPHDYATNFYFNRLSKGKHIVEMEYYIDRKGAYQSGSCSAQCAYSPEFCGRASAYQMQVEE